MAGRTTGIMLVGCTRSPSVRATYDKHPGLFSEGFRPSLNDNSSRRRQNEAMILFMVPATSVADKEIIDKLRAHSNACM